MLFFRAEQLCGIFHGFEGLGGEHLFSETGRVQFAHAVIQVVILIYVQSANRGAVDAEHDTGFAGRVAGLVDAVIEGQDRRRLAGMQDRAFDFPQAGISRFGLIILPAISNHFDPVMDTAVNSPGIVIMDRCVLTRLVYVQPN